MLKKLVDTNIFIDRFVNPERFKGIFLSEGLVYLSAVVLMEIRAGAHSKEALKAVQELSNYFKRVGRIIVPTLKDYQQAGELIAKLQKSKGYNIIKSSSITNDCLIASSAKNSGAMVYTQNKRDFEAIHTVFDFRIVWVDVSDPF
jgi:predicted nucleic acid-binding protein